MKGLPVGQGPSAGDVLHPAAVRDQAFLGHHVVEVAGVELGEAVLLGNVDLQIRVTICYYSSTAKLGRKNDDVFVSVVP